MASVQLAGANVTGMSWSPEVHEGPGPGPTTARQLQFKALQGVERILAGSSSQGPRGP